MHIISAYKINWVVLIGNNAYLNNEVGLQQDGFGYTCMRKVGIIKTTSFIKNE